MSTSRADWGVRAARDISRSPAALAGDTPGETPVGVTASGDKPDGSPWLARRVALARSRACMERARAWVGAER